MSDLKLAHEIIQELDRQRKKDNEPVTALRIAAAGGLIYYGALPYEPGTPSGKTLPTLRKMVIELAALCMRFVDEGDWSE